MDRCGPLAACCICSSVIKWTEILKFVFKKQPIKRKKPKHTTKPQEYLDTLKLVLLTRDAAPDLEDLGGKKLVGVD